MKHTRSLLLLVASAGIAGCGDPAGWVLAPPTLAEGRGSTGQTGGSGYTWTIRKELVEVHMSTPTGEMPVDPVSPYTINPFQTKWFTFRITYTRSTGGPMGPTAVISDNLVAACATLGAGYECTSPESDFGLPGGAGQIGIKTWTVSSSGTIVGMLDIKNIGARCPKDRTLTNVAVLTSNGEVRSSDAKVPINSPDCAQPKQKRACNQGVGNGPEGCDPGNSNHNQPSNDENGGTPGNPGRKGGSR